MAVHVVLNQKGGVGKSTISVNLAAVTADVLNHHDDPDASSPVLALSVDPQGSAVWWASRMENRLPFHIAQAHDDLDGLQEAQGCCPASTTSTSTPPAGSTWTADDDRSDPLGRGPAADVLRAVLDMADQVIVPIETEPLSFDPTARTINKVLTPRGLRYLVVINNWDPRDGDARPQPTGTSSRPTAGRWPTRSSAITSCMPAPAPTVRSSPSIRSTGVALQAREDFYRLALELNVGAAR